MEMRPTMSVAVALAVGVTILGLLLVRKAVSPKYLREHGPIGALYSTFGVMYSVVLASTVVGVWERYETASMTVLAESNALFDLVRLAEGLPSEYRDRLQQLALAYGDAVVQTEWPAMAEERAPSREAADSMVELFRAYAILPDPATRNDPAYTASLEQLNVLDDARGERLTLSKLRLPGPMWLVLLLGGTLTVLFTYLLGTESRASHILGAAAMAAMIAMLLVLVRDLDAPFRQPLGIPDQELSNGLAILREEVQTHATVDPIPVPTVAP